MLPEVLTSSYSKYKEDTKVFTSWLSSTAVACGYKSKAARSNDSGTGSDNNVKLTGKARKEAKLAAEAEKAAKRAARKNPGCGPRIVKHSITTNDLLQQAELISKSTEKNIHVPAGLKKVILRAISARKRCASWFQTTKVVNEYSNAAHEHFIEVLEKALVLLEPHLDQHLKKNDSMAHAKKAGQSILELSNRYADLEIEDFEDPEDLDAVITSIELSKKAPDQTVVDVYELEEESSDMQISLMIFCFFEDMHVIQAFLHDVWRSYKNGETSLLIASFTTNAAFGVVRQNEESILGLAPNLLDKTRSYETIAMIIYFADAFSKGSEDPSERLKSSDSLRPTPFDDFIYLSVSRILMKFAFLAKFPDGGSNLQYPVPIPPLRFSYISRPELLDDPIIKKREVEDKLLSQFFMDLHLYHGAKHDMKNHLPGRTTPPFDDELSKGLRQLTLDGNVRVWLVFASRIWLDIIEILGDEVTRPHEQLVQEAKELKATLLSTGAFDDIDKSIRWLTRDSDMPDKLMSTAGEWVVAGVMPFFKNDALSRMQPDFNKPFEDARGQKRNVNAKPAYAITEPREREIGKVLTSLNNFQIEEAKKVNMRGFQPPKDLSFGSLRGEVIKVDKHPSLMTETERLKMDRDLRVMAGLDEEGPTEEHEENARKLNLRLIKPHEDMNFIFKYNPLWCGTVLFQFSIDSEQAGLSLSNYHTVIGNVAHIYKSAQRAGFIHREWPDMEHIIALHKDSIFDNKLPSSSQEAFRSYAKAMNLERLATGRGNVGPQCKASVFSENFRKYFSHRTSLESSLTITKDLVQQNMLQVLESKHRRRDVKRNFTSQQFLAGLRNFLPTVIPDITFDYITFLQTCYCLVEEIRQSIEKDLGVSVPLQKMLEDSRQPSYITMTHGMLWEAMKGNDSKLKVAAKVLENFSRDPKPRMYVETIEDHWFDVEEASSHSSDSEYEILM